jgi:hypothetical protein
MTFTAEEVRHLSRAQRGWSPIPEGCPPAFVQQICEWRASRLPEFRSAVVRGPQGEPLPVLVATDLKQRLAELSIL